jgi:hypothetical protein
MHAHVHARRPVQVELTIFNATHGEGKASLVDAEDVTSAHIHAGGEGGGVGGLGDG